MKQCLRVPSGISVGEIANVHLGVEVHFPAEQTGSVDRRIAFVCLPGGGMRRQFFDLPVAGDDSFSFAKAMTAQGYTCVLVDHPGIGDSDQPQDGFLLTPALLAQIHAAVLQALPEHLPDLAGIATIGVGHSMGAMISLIQQYQHPLHAGLVLLGFGFDGLPQYLHPKVLGLLDDKAALQAASVEFAKKFFKVGYPVMQGGGGRIYQGGNADRAGVAGIKAVSTHMLAVPAFMSMLPHHWDAMANAIDVPVLVALGDKDLVKPPDNVDQMFSSSPAVDLMVLPETGHSQFLFPSRLDLFSKLGHWAEQQSIRR